MHKHVKLYPDKYRANMAKHRPEAGSYTNIHIPDDGTIVKLTGNSFNKEQAEHISRMTADYAADVATLGIPVARLLEVGPHKTPDGRFKVRQVMEYVDGPSAFSLSREARYAAARDILGHIATVPAHPDDANRLKVPVDYKLGNFIMGQGGPVMIDVYPPYRWGEENQVVLPEGVAVHGHAKYRTRYLGYRDGAMSRIIVGTMSLAEPNVSVAGLVSLGEEHRQGDGEWYGHILPADLENATRQAIHGAVTEFITDTVEIYRSGQ